MSTKWAAETEAGLASLPLDELERRAREANGQALTLRDWTALAEAWRIAVALREARGNRTAAARALGIGRRTLYTKIDKLGLVPTWVLSEGGGAADATPAPLHAGASSDPDPV